MIAFKVITRAFLQLNYKWEDQTLLGLAMSKRIATILQDTALSSDVHYVAAANVQPRRTTHMG